MDTEPKKRPGWGIIEKYMPDATPEAQEEAYQNLLGLVEVLMQIDDRLEAEKRQAQPKLPGIELPP
jgi:hypothetical protein